ncbi:hypothetical protein K443DRAFT_3874 [Laccaria amethystina LaAM-08-1]|uniref:Uncharacterized protein n=1 Tax=Laccaria amethystina LaAM-08-1 TaxID=1095629 RepID=A0A0C9WZX4_9AGAR|nr:hypothetical protein K443DRAFT_3874 [Laccaria amethystina LaAM-08-1]
MAGLAARRQIPALVFAFTTLPASSLLAVNAQTSRFKLQCLKAPILSSVLVPTPVFESTTNLTLETGLLGGIVRRHSFASSRPQKSIDSTGNLSRRGLGRPLTPLNFFSKVIACSLAVPPVLSPFLLSRKLPPRHRDLVSRHFAHSLNERIKFSYSDVRSALARFHNSPSPIIAHSGGSILLSST